MPPAAPSDLTPFTLHQATKRECQRWIELTNLDAGKRVLNKTGRLEQLKAQLSSHFSLPPFQPLSGKQKPPQLSRIDMDIKKRQWDHLCMLGDEWELLGDAFKLGEWPLLLPRSYLRSPPFKQTPGHLRRPQSTHCDSYVTP